MVNIPQEAFIYRILVSGPIFCGKTNILSKYLNDEFKYVYTPTIDMDVFSKPFRYQEISGKLKIYDIGGHENSASILLSYYKRGHGILLIFNISDSNSFNQIDLYIETILKYAPKDIKVILFYIRNFLFITIVY